MCTVLCDSHCNFNWNIISESHLCNIWSKVEPLPIHCFVLSFSAEDHDFQLLYLNLYLGLPSPLEWKSPQRQALYSSCLSVYPQHTARHIAGARQIRVNRLNEWTNIRNRCRTRVPALNTKLCSSRVLHREDGRWPWFKAAPRSSVATSHVWLLQFNFKTLWVKSKLKLSSSGTWAHFKYLVPTSG